MGSTVMMYVLPMMLGQTYNLGKDKPGLQIFPTNVNESATVIEQYFTDTQYRLVDDISQVKDFLDVSGKLSLKIKSGLVDVNGEGSYAKKISSYDNTLQILIKVHFETVTLTIPSHIKPLDDWPQFNEEFLGTHYVRSITMGGDLIASIDVKAQNKFDMERIKGALNAGITTKGGAFEGSIQAKLEKLRNETQDSSSLEINYCATVPLEGVSYTTQGLLDLVREFPNHVRKINNGLGNPLRMELFPLKSLQSDYKEYLENGAIGEQLEEMDYQLDDILATRKAISIFVSGFPPDVPRQVKQKIEDFTDKMDNLYGIYLKSITELDTSVGASTQPITDAINAYKDGGYSMPQKYLRKFKQMKQEIYREAPELKPRIGGAQYHHWGRSKCEGPDAETAFSGVITSSQTIQNGGSDNLLCAPFNPEIPDPSNYLPGFDPEDEEQYYENLLVSPLKYMGAIERFSSMDFKHIACSVCRSPHRTATLIKPGDTKCPKKWTKEYEGLLMAPGIDDAKGEYVCVDKNMQEAVGNITFGTTKGTDVFKIQEVKIECGGLPCGPYADDKAVPCVVCTI
ncbi:uncharacterized protein LOC129956705 [Argiope bruennichi]|uniref:uncharacterized protein LOC129956705 n=1 Tax=Argiope bruennichi TaxID=94029 RepID=UPI0024953D0F|nr:uncharacterized protein LOC129956705 [Argiope bruennichi]